MTSTLAEMVWITCAGTGVVINDPASFWKDYERLPFPEFCARYIQPAICCLKNELDYRKSKTSQ
jgi:hypothetical protein